ncbi:hypothetical protein [Falsibacillus pallidus]|uniref:Uncharacterized protein n=1 Tax=Falsibacillus pallidus TaxID=493781 RepID=A0A370GRI3_9BACI|nr:hypothetical protein [Falsibacillus pallidus]RDI45856.1 hypothetical protein DFR59_102491 [Falsibacillus pallidus]
MKKELLFAFSAFFFMSLHAAAGAFTNAEQKALEPRVEAVYHEDVTGTGKKSDITLKGIPFDQESNYLKAIWADVLLDNQNKIRINYEPGYEPSITFKDFNHDRVKDMLQSSVTGGSGGFYSYKLTTLKEGVETDIPMPPSLQVQGQFADGYKAIVTIPEIGKTYTVDLSARKDDYLRLGIYKNGKLNEPTELMVDPIAYFKPSKIAGKKGWGLIGYQRVSGAYHADGIGTVESYWYYENGKWQMVHAKWITY